MSVGIQNARVATLPEQDFDIKLASSLGQCEVSESKSNMDEAQALSTTTRHGKDIWEDGDEARAVRA